VSRGNPESSLKSGTALAMVQSMSLQFMSGLQQSYVSLIEDVGSGIINMLKDYAAVPRIAAITGITNRTYMDEFTGDDLSTVNRVMVDLGNPLAATTAGKAEMAEQMLQMGIVKTPEQYFTVLNTGRLDAMTEDTQSELFLIKDENEKMLKGVTVRAIATDQHKTHIREHKAILSSDFRNDEVLMEATLNHINEHMNLLRTTDPALLEIIEEQPVGPIGGSPAQQQNPNIPASSIEGQQVQQTMEQPQTPAAVAPDINLPTPPPPFQNLPIKPGQ